MKLLYDLNEQQMKEVYEEYQDYLYKSDIEAIYENIDNIEEADTLTDDEMKKAVDYLKIEIDNYVCYSDYARSAFCRVMEERNQRLKEQIRQNEMLIKQING